MSSPAKTPNSSSVAARIFERKSKSPEDSSIPRIFSCSAKKRNGIGLEACAGASRRVREDEGRLHGVGDAAEVLDDSRLIGSDEIRNDRQDRVDPQPVHFSSELDRALGDVVGGGGDGIDMAFGALLHDFHDTLSFAEREAGLFTSRAA